MQMRCTYLHFETVNKEMLITRRKDGYLFDKEVILEYIIHQKKDIAKKLKEFSKQQNREKVFVQKLSCSIGL